MLFELKCKTQFFQTQGFVELNVVTLYVIVMEAKYLI